MTDPLYYRRRVRESGEDDIMYSFYCGFEIRVYRERGIARAFFDAYDSRFEFEGSTINSALRQAKRQADRLRGA